MALNSPDSLTKATTKEWYTSLFGACFIAFGLGSLLTNYAASFVPYIIILGIVMHGWGMYKMHTRNS